VQAGDDPNDPEEGFDLEPYFGNWPQSPA
jgi:hypothetical protein